MYNFLLLTQCMEMPLLSGGCVRVSCVFYLRKSIEKGAAEQAPAGVVGRTFQWLAGTSVATPRWVVITNPVMLLPCADGRFSSLCKERAALMDVLVYMYLCARCVWLSWVSCLVSMNVGLYMKCLDSRETCGSAAYLWFACFFCRPLSRIL